MAGLDTAKEELIQSTLPAGGATRGACVHDPLPSDFNPRSPRGERPKRGKSIFFGPLFQSTLPAGGATPADPDMCPRT